LQLFIVIFFSFTLLSATTVHDKLYQKLIVSPSKDIRIAEENLLTLKVHFHEDTYSESLQKKYRLKFSVEKIGDYSMVVIKPITVVSLKKELLIELTPLFQELFFIDEEKSMVKKSKLNLATIISQKASVSSKIKKHESMMWFETIGLQWVALLILASMGLILSLLNRRKLSKIEKVQKDLKLDQKNIENEINNLGVTDA